MIYVFESAALLQLLDGAAMDAGRLLARAQLDALSAGDLLATLKTRAVAPDEVEAVFARLDIEVAPVDWSLIRVHATLIERLAPVQLELPAQFALALAQTRRGTLVCATPALADAATRMRVRTTDGTMRDA